MGLPSGCSEALSHWLSSLEGEIGTVSYCRWVLGRENIGMEETPSPDISHQNTGTALYPNFWKSGSQRFPSEKDIFENISCSQVKPQIFSPTSLTNRSYDQEIFPKYSGPPPHSIILRHTPVLLPVACVLLADPHLLNFFCLSLSMSLPGHVS